MLAVSALIWLFSVALFGLGVIFLFMRSLRAMGLLMVGGSFLVWFLSMGMCAVAPLRTGGPATVEHLPEAPALERPRSRGKWQGGGQGRSRMDDSPISVYWLETETRVRHTKNYLRPRLEVECGGRRIHVTVTVYMSTEPVDRYGDYRTRNVRIRFDDEPPAWEQWSIGSTDESLVSPSGQAFAERLVKARRLRVQFKPDKRDSEVIEFDTTGFDQVMGEIQSTCGLQSSQAPPPQAVSPQIVAFQSGDLTLRGVIYKPEGPGPFPGVLYNHGSAPGMLNKQAFDALGPRFAERGWLFFAPYRRGQGLSAAAGPFIGDEIAAARSRRMWLGLLLAAPSALLLYVAIARRRQRWFRAAWGVSLALLSIVAIHVSATQAAAGTMVRLLETDHLDDQVAAFQWLEKQDFVDGKRIATAGNSFGGIEALLGAERIEYCAAIDASGGAESWSTAPRLRTLMTRAARHAKAPAFFFHAENDYDLSPGRSLSTEMKNAGKISELKIYPAFGKSASEGHSFAWSGSAVWSADVFRFLEAHCVK